MKNTELLKDLDPVFQSLENIMYKHGLKNIRIWKGNVMQEVVANDGNAERNLVFERRVNKEWEERKKVR